MEPRSYRNLNVPRDPQHSQGPASHPKEDEKLMLEAPFEMLFDLTPGSFFSHDTIKRRDCHYLAMTQSIVYLHPGTKLRALKTAVVQVTAGSPGHDGPLQSPALTLPQNQLLCIKHREEGERWEITGEVVHGG